MVPKVETARAVFSMIPQLSIDGEVFGPTVGVDYSMAMQQEPIDWRYLPYIKPM